LSQAMYHRVSRIVRDVGTSMREEVAVAVKSSMLLYLPALVVLPLRFNWITIELSNLWSCLFILIGIAVYNLAYPYLLRFTLAGKPLKDEGTKETIDSILNKHDMKRVQVFEWPTNDSKVANALVCGLIHKRVFVASDLLENLSEDEVNAILAQK